jgi:hypothetical protein
MGANAAMIVTLAGIKPAVRRRRAVGLNSAKIKRFDRSPALLAAFRRSSQIDNFADNLPEHATGEEASQGASIFPKTPTRRAASAPRRKFIAIHAPVTIIRN